MKHKDWDKMYITIIFLTIIVGVASVPLMTDYVLWGRELQVSLSKIEAIGKNINKMFPYPVVIKPWDSLDYGYEAASLQADIFLVIPVLFRVFGVGLGMSYKLTLLLVNIAVGVISYLCCLRCYKREGIALIGSMLYTWCPYRLNEMYVNGK